MANQASAAAAGFGGMDIAAIQNGLRAREFSAVEVAQDALARVHE